MWAKKGKQPCVKTKSQHHKRLNVAGWVDPVRGRHGIIQIEKGNSDGFIKLLRNILYRYKETIIDLWVDNARWHKGAKIDDFLNNHQELRIHYIPKYHPELNKQETLWRFMRYEETTNTYYESFEDMRNAVFNRSRKWKPKKIHQLCHFN
jgi:transposase